VIGDREAAPPFLLIAHDTLRFNTASDHWLDVTAFTGMVEADKARPSAIAQLGRAVALYRGGFLEGFSVRGSPAFEEWMLSTEERLARQMSSALRHLAAACEQRGEYEQAQSYAWRQIGLDPWDEVAHQQLMRALPASARWRAWTGFWTWLWPAVVGWCSSPARPAAARRPWSRNSPGAPRGCVQT